MWDFDNLRLKKLTLKVCAGKRGSGPFQQQSSAIRSTILHHITAEYISSRTMKDRPKKLKSTYRIASCPR